MEEAAAGNVGDLVLQLGVGGVFALLVIRTVLDFLSKQREKKSNGNGNGGISSSAVNDMFAINRSILSFVEDLHKWHDVKDEDQVPVWYVRKSLERLIGELSKSVNRMTKAIEDQTAAFKAMVEAGE
jgi:hypothetical protein